MPNYLKKIEGLETLAAIDLGSNALRAVIVRKLGKIVKVVKNFREPLRLGEDVFKNGSISEEKMRLTENAFIKLLHIFTAYNVSDVRAMATSAMRDSVNGPKLAHQILLSTGIEIETIKGNEEARLIFNAVNGQISLHNKRSILMDVGGGSTELTVVKDGIIRGIKSFDVGTVRLIQYENQATLEEKISATTATMMKFIQTHLGNRRPELFVGTGGNLRRIGKIRKKMLAKASSEWATFEEIDHMEEAILSMSYVDRIRSLELDQNRADVILPGIMLVHHLMQGLKMDKINLPRVGLKEGIILSMLQEAPKKFLLKD